MIYNNIHKSDIIKVLEPVYISYPGGAYKDHFIDKNILYRVKTEPTNNGNFTAVNSAGKLRHFNTIYNNIVEIVKRGPQ